MCKIALREAKCVLTLLVDPAEKFIIVSCMLNPAQKLSHGTAERGRTGSTSRWYVITWVGISSFDSYMM